MEYFNPIDKDKTTDTPNTLPYPHHIGSVAVRPEDVGKLKSRALSAMEEQTHQQLSLIQRQVELLAQQANAIKQRVEISHKIYTALISFEPFVGNIYHLYEQEGAYKLMMIAPDEWGRTKKENLIFLNSVRLLSDHTWEILS